MYVGMYVYPVVVVKVDALFSLQCIQLLCICKLLDLLGKQLTKIKPKKIKIVMASATPRMEISKTTVSLRSGDYSYDVNVVNLKVNQGQFLRLENLRYVQLIKTYSHLRGVEMDDADGKPLLPIHVILGSWVYTQITMYQEFQCESECWHQGLKEILIICVICVIGVGVAT